MKKEVQNFDAEITPDERREFSWKEWVKSPIKTYRDYIKNSIIPIKYSHQVTMDIKIPKGDRQGVALIPCTIYAMDHGIDLNPALIRKKDSKPMIYIKPEKKYKFIQDESINTDPFYIVSGNQVKYNPVHIKVQLTDKEIEEGYVMKDHTSKNPMVQYQEFERCEKCKQKLVISEVKQTRYRSCPSVSVKLGDPAKEDTVVPVQFGVNKEDITGRLWATPLLIGCFVVVTGILFDFDIAGAINTFSYWIGSFFSNPGTPSIVNPYAETIAISLLWVIRVLFIVMVWIIMIPKMIYGTIKMWQWYKKVKDKMTVNKSWSV